MIKTISKQELSTVAEQMLAPVLAKVTARLDVLEDLAQQRAKSAQQVQQSLGERIAGLAADVAAVQRAQEELRRLYHQIETVPAQINAALLTTNNAQHEANRINRATNARLDSVLEAARGSVQQLVDKTKGSLQVTVVEAYRVGDAARRQSEKDLRRLEHKLQELKEDYDARFAVLAEAVKVAFDPTREQ